MDKREFNNWNERIVNWKQKQVEKINSLENIPLIQKNNYIKEIGKFNQIYLQFYVQSNGYFAMQESINFFMKEGNKLEAREKEKNLEKIVEDLKEISADMYWKRDKIDFLTYNFEVADYMGEMGIDFSENFYLDTIDEGHKY